MTIKRRIKYIILEIYWWTRGRFCKNPPLPDKVPQSILFICQGNIIRSAFAERIASTRAKKLGFASVRFYSSGVAVKPGTPSPQLAVEVAHHFDVNLSDHKSRQLTADLYHDFDFIVAMEWWHVQNLRKMVPQHKSKIYLLPLFNNEPAPIRRNYHKYNIPDPYGKSRDDFEAAFQAIQICLNSLFRDLQKHYF